MKITVSVIKADIGSIAGHVRVHQDTIEVAKKKLETAKEEGLVIDYYVFNAGDDLELLITHTKGVDNPEIHELSWEIFKESAKKAKELKLYAAGQDLLKESFSGNIKGMGPGVAEIEFEERPAEPFAVFAADKTEPGAFNLPVFRIFADPFNTAGLIIDPKMHAGFKFIIMDVIEGKEIELQTPEDLYDILALIGHTGRYIIKFVYSKDPTIGVAAAVSTQRLSLIAGRYIGKDDPVCIIRAQHGLPAMGEILEAFSQAHLVKGWMRGSHHGPLMPVPLKYSQCTRFDGPPRVVGLGFNLCEGKLIGPIDLFDDPAFDLVRQKAMLITDYIRSMGPFEPHMLGPEELEYTTLPEVLKRLKDRWREST
ncbi:MAG: fructose-1,6-bisphosphatase [Crenarchaeota archaeon]|nr:fructose-1,6-bisphosphatase [Thermoproteota archaeon]